MKTFLFEPKEDITIYELALALRVHLMCQTTNGIAGAFTVSDDMFDEFVEAAGISIRNFEEQRND